MLKCPFCHFDNEDGALFCEQCKSDLAGVAPTTAPEVAVAQVVEATPVSEPGTVPVAAVVEATPVIGEASVVAVAEAVAVESPVPPAAPVTPPASPAPVAAAASVAAPPPPAAPTVPPAAAPAAPQQAAPAAPIPPGAQVRLLVLRGLKRNVEYPIYEGLNFIGRADEKPVDIDLEDQEPPDRIWSSRQHAVINLENGQLTIEDLNSSNGTYVNRQRIYPGQKQPLNVNDVIQIGTVQLKVII
ncbi:MAG TPA: FHA domain-containing protein [Gemmataceae bacterium]|nr:FHA domain-containing protein [Gemmataceae bacterium]